MVYAADAAIEYDFRDSGQNLLFEIGSCIFALVMILLILYFARGPKKGTSDYLKYRVRRYLEK